MAPGIPADHTARARSLTNGGSWVPPPPLDAATVVLVRQATGNPEVLLMRRPATMAFAPGMFVFPGGRVDPSQDAVPELDGDINLGPATPPALAHALTVAAVRETFEEAGVLLAIDDTAAPAQPDRDWAADRRASELAAAFPAVLARRRLGIRTADLVPIARWITPEVESRRFDTRFFMAALPAGQSADPHATETDSARWLRPADALTAHHRGQLPMLRPTVAVLERLVGVPSVAAALALAAATVIVPMMPRARLRGDTIHWAIVNTATGEVLVPTTPAPASEQRGVR